MSETLVNIVAVGNVLMGDDGIGVVALERLARRLGEVPGVVLHDAGLAVSDVLDDLDPTVPLIAIDAVDTGDAPGTVCRMPVAAVRNADGALAGCLSLHEINLVRALRLSALAGHVFRDVTIFGVQPAHIEWGCDLSGEVAAALDELIEAVEAHVDAVCAAAAGENAS